MEFDLYASRSANDVFRPLQTYVDHDLTKRHISSQIDHALGFNIKHIEEILQSKAKGLAPDKQFDQWGPTLHGGAQTWVGLDFQILQTTYHDLKSIFEIIKPKNGECIIDLGAGYGRLGIFLQHFYPRTKFVGIELVQERVDEGNRILEKLKSTNKKLIAFDLSELTELPAGDIFFIYDFGSVTHIKKILEILKHTPGRRLLVVKGRIARQIMLQDVDYGEGIKIKKLSDVYLY